MAKGKDNTSNVIVIKLSEHKVPQFREVRGEDYIFFGKNNDYPSYLLNLYNRSAKHNAIINAKAFYIFGHGSESGADHRANEDKETLDDVMKKAILDYELFGGFAIEVIWAFGGKVAELRHINFSHVRSNEDNSKFYYTKDWFKRYYDDNDNETRLPRYNAKENKDFETWNAFNPEDKTGTQLYYYKCYRPELDIYPLPDYIGAIPHIEIDFEIANYWYNAVKNGFTASHIITFYGDPGTQEEQKKLEERITKKFTGTDKAGRIILNFSQNKEKGGSEIANIIPQDLDKQFNVLNQTVQQEIFSGHRITSPMLMGIQTPGKLGGRNEIIEANELFQNTYITPKQKIFNAVFTKFLSLMGGKGEIELQKLEPIGLDFTSNERAWNILTSEEQRMAIGKEPIKKDRKSEEAERIIANVQALSPLVVNEIMKNLTRNEIRSLVGLKPIRGGDKIIAPVIPGQADKISKEGEEEFSMVKKIPIELFKKYKGAARKGQLIACRMMHWEDTLDLKAKEHILSKQNFATLRNNQRSVLDLLVKDPLMPPERIAEALNISTEEVNNIIIFLKKRELLEESKQKSGDGENAITVRVLTPVADAIRILEQTPAPTERIEVRYSYEFRPPFTKEDADASRDFCLELMEESKQREAEGRLWTREEIEQMQNESGMSVWESRGGWYTKPNTDIHFPHCRHVWVQHLITIIE